MGMEIYLLPPGTGEFREKLLKKTLSAIKGPDYSEILCLAPTNLIVKNFRDEFHDAAGSCYIPPRCMTLGQLAKQIYRTHGDRTVLPGAFIPVIISGLTECGMGLAALVAEFVSELKRQFPCESPESIRKTLLDAFAGHSLPDEAAKRTLTAADMFAAYQKALDENNAVDEDDVLSLSAGMARENLSIKTLLLDGFYEVTPAEEKLLASLLERAEHTVITIPISNKNDDLSYCYSNFLRDYFKAEPVLVPAEESAPEMLYRPAPSMEDEVADIARRIKGDFISGRQRDLDLTLLVFPKLSLYQKMVERVFRKYGIPCNILTPVPLNKIILSLLEAVSEDYPRLIFAKFLTSPDFSNIPDSLKEKVPGICLEAGIIKGKQAWLKAFKQKKIEDEGVSLFKVIETVKFPSNTGTYSKYIAVFLDILKKLGFNGLKELDDVFKKFSLLDGFIRKGTNLEGFIDAVRSVLDSARALVDAGGVKVASLSRVRGLEPRMLYMGGLKDGDIPSRPEMDFLLPDGVRRRLGLVDMKRHMHLEEHIFRRLASAARGLYLSYPEMEGDKFYLPSVFLSGGMQDRQEPAGIFSLEDEMLSQPGKPLSAHIREISGIKRPRKGSAIRVTDVDAYRACPRRFFIERSLRLTPPEVMDFEMEPMALGSIVHEVMEKLMPGAPVELEAFAGKASETLDAVLKDKPIDSYFKKMIRETFLEIVPKLFEIEAKLQEEGFTLKEAEYAMEEEPLKDIILKGKVDRIDAGPDGAVEIIDYKTGALAMSSTAALKKGANLQLFIYAAMLKTLGMRPERVGIYSLKDVHLKWFPTSADRRKGLILEDFITGSLKFLEATVENMRKGDFRAAPIEEQMCRNCPERPYCPHIQGASS